MANGGGGSRIGGFFRGVLMGLIVCAVGAVVLSLAAPLPERAAPGVESPGAETGVLGGAAVDGAVQGTVRGTEGTGPAATAQPEPGGTATVTVPSADVIVVPADEGTAEPSAPAADGAAAPQPTFETGPATGDTDPPAAGSDAVTPPQAPSQ